jgi:N-acetylmuramoyl-L-alanine amidase CwlA
MAYVMKENLANRKNYGSLRNTNNIKYLVYHYTANDGDSDEANGNYFRNNVVKASAHYFVDNNSVTRTVPDDYIAYSVGRNFGKNNLFGVCTNANSLNIEICDEVRNGVYDFSEATLANAIELGKKLMKQYNIPIDRVVRHYDVCSKICPKPFVDNNNAWIAFKNRLVAENTPTQTVVDEGSNTNYLVKVLADVLNVRSGPSTNHGVVTAIHKNEVYTIVKETTNSYGNKWGKLKSGAGWISLSNKYITTDISTKPVAATPVKKNLSVGTKVRIKSSATKYCTGQTIPGSVKKKTYTVKQIGTSRYPSGVLLKEIASWVNRSDLEF